MTDAPRYFHGGVPGLNVGDWIVPHPPRVHPGCAECEARAKGRQIRMPDGRLSEPPTRHPDRAYLSTDKDYARWYASRGWLGDLYRVRPEGDVAESEEDPFPTFTAAAAVIVQVVDRSVRLTDKDRRRRDRRWKCMEDADRRAGLGIPRQAGRW
ncbi:hypothetical protein ACIRST_39060 [Kitasatospora sp. NPDC101447]|uniref:hypothetical protein n=1 Tax=Kitasatospora sp. NPDC101447 TaxID=3364102 RepID=UPI00382CC4FC